MLVFVKQFIFSFLPTVGFAILFNAPRSSLFYTGLTGGTGWTIYFFLKHSGFSSPFSSLIAAIVVSILGEIFARVDKKPVTAFIIPGIVPLVPGYGMYLSMINLINNRFYDAAVVGTDAILTGGSIAMGIIMVSSFAKIIKKVKKNKQLKKPSE
ncbi:Uncharacterized membrane protein YjjB, DUF3815 family [Peptoclostridium litorale DSM 5388]|uniref:Membrane spanning protein n=1 Tax=Peptoclostridium litorale DSM 5388 TaxID=1121324 RepID=A0A069RA30_PEPLI|nr:threonine/serine exporter family protein [Peptoclostridium litorale]KDR93934.1 membrane spanning protein [Peptoclostridium litorale DSM 5388]KDR95361.1 membrane spanning protein [Peptoclostridium litorale DSM 5388]SIN88885.1 Uncharacterized membrane protein YjjB, DUF3815 family [Peptoclostridium litorale DSM 5388]